MSLPDGPNEIFEWKLYSRDSATGRIVLSAKHLERSIVIAAAAAQWKIGREPVQIIGPAGEQFYHEEIQALIDDSRNA
jgi:hypothetical protein